MRKLLPLLLALASIRCATVAHGRHQTVPVSSTPSGAAVRATCGARSWDAGVTPVNVELRRKSELCTVTLTKEGFAPETVTFDRTRSAFVYGNVVPGAAAGAMTGGGIGLAAALLDASDTVVVSATALGFALGFSVPVLVDSATGAMYKHFPERVEVTLRPR